jgi:hypothetical protein
LSNSDFSSARFKYLDIMSNIVFPEERDACHAVRALKYLDIMSNIVFPEERDACHAVRALKYLDIMTCIMLSRRAEHAVRAYVSGSLRYRAA